MKEHFQDYGIRKWAGNDLIELQSEPMEALQKLVEPYAPCILQGCEITENGDDITIASGLVALQGKDYKGEDCVKIARFAGVADTTHPVYLTLECETESRVYGDSKSKAIAYHYRAVATTQEPEKPYLKITTDDNKRLVDTLGITQKLDREEAQKGIVSFTKDTAEKHTNIQSGSTLGTLFGKIERWFSDLKPIAFKEKVAQSDFDKDLTEAFDNKVDNTEDGLNGAINQLSESSVQPTDNDFYISQYANGGTSNKTYWRRRMSALWAYIKGKLFSDTGVNISGNAATATKATQDSAGNVIKDTYAKKTSIPTVDTALSATSTNPVQNQAVKNALDGKANSSHTHDYLPLSGGTITGNLRLKGSGNYGNKLNFGDSEYVYLHEETDDVLTIKANEIKLNASSGGVNVTSGQLKENGARVYSPNNTPPIATSSVAGLMSAGDKTKLDTCVRLHYLGYSDKEGNVTKIGGLSSMNITVSKSATTGLYYLYNIGNDNKNVFVIINSTETNVFARLNRILHNGTARVSLSDNSGNGVDKPFMIMIIGI